MNPFKAVPECDIVHNMKIKEYPDGSCKITVADKQIFRESGYELRSASLEKTPKPKNMKNDSRSDSICRAKTRVSDIIRMNSFKYFVTLTLSPEKVNRSSPSEVVKKTGIFLSNLVQRCNLNYVLVPEYHKKNNAIHLHGFFSGDITLVDSGTVKALGHKKPIKVDTAKRFGINPLECITVYNLPQWTLGFSTAYETFGQSGAMANYMIKYITKEVKKIFGNFYLAGGKELVRDVPYSLSDTDFEAFLADATGYCEPTNTRFKYKDTSLEGGA